MELILFYALLIGGIGLAATTYVMLLVLPVRLIFRRFGVLAAAAFATLMAAVLYTLFEPPFGGSDIGFAPAGMLPHLYIVGLVSEPPMAMLAASLVVSALGFALILGDRLLGRRRRRATDRATPAE